MSYYSKNNEKSLYNLYADYDRNLIDFTLNTFIKDYKTMILVKKRFGNNFDGIGATTLISYMDEQKIKTFLMRLEQRLKAFKLLIEQGKSLEDISQIVKDKSEIELARIVSNVLNYDKPVVKIEEPLKTLDEIINKYNISVDDLYNALMIIKDNNKRLCYMYTYGIKKQQMSKKMVCKILDINAKQYDKYILETQKSLPVLLTRLNQKRKNKEENKNFIEIQEILKNIDFQEVQELPKVKDIPSDLHKIDIYELIPNAHLIMDNPLCNIDIVNIPNIEEIVDIYSVCKDSNELLNKINIDKKRLIMIYISNLDKFDDISEIVGFIVMNTDINIIMLLIEKLFNNNIITSLEKELLYLKLLQIKNKKITNDIISMITGLDIEDIEQYRIMTNNDKINTINKIL